VTAPKEYADVVEALLRAIYVDSGNSLETVEATLFCLIVGKPLGGIERLLVKSSPRNSKALWPTNEIQVRILNGFNKQLLIHLKSSHQRNTTFGHLPYVSVELCGVELCKGAGKNKKGALTAACKYALHFLQENV
jgi:dsRNA-specific ribonuclease